MGPSFDPDDPDTYTYLAGLENDRGHGGHFDYRSVVTSMLGWVVERVGGDRLPELIGRELWSPMGAEVRGLHRRRPFGNPPWRPVG